MSHFTVLVIGDDVEKQLQPFHEFECTGISDEYVQEIDNTEDCRAEYEKATRIRYKSADGKLCDPYEPRFYREFTAEETAKVGHSPMGSGHAGGVSFSSQDWGDGRGYRSKVHFVPDGFEEVDVPVKDFMSFRDFVDYQYGRKTILQGEAPNVDGEHKFGYTVLDKSGEVIRTVDRTNPNNQWDWYQIGGRWSGYFKVRSPEFAVLGNPSLLATMDKDYKRPSADRADQALKGDIDWDGMRNEKGDSAAQTYDLFTNVTTGLPPIVPWDTVRESRGVGDIDTNQNWREQMDAAQKEFHDQPAVRAMHANKELMWSDASDFACSREEYIERARNGAGVTFAVLKDGKWHERGSMGWWGCVSDEKDAGEWVRQFASLIDGLPDNTLLTLVDCHI